jgi:hypothetical protein
VQGRASEACGARDLREYETQTETGMNRMNISQMNFSMEAF